MYQTTAYTIDAETGATIRRMRSETRIAASSDLMARIPRLATFAAAAGVLLSIAAFMVAL